MSSLLATFPSPSTGTLEIGPLSIHMYGITLLVAIVCAIVVTGLRWTRRGGDWDLVLRAAVWGVAAGIVGARLYHVVTSYDQLPDEWWGPFAVWEGGLGIWGGILFGVIAGGIVVWRSGQSIALFADCLAPGLLLAQASAAGATGGIRSSSASPRICPGRSTSMPSTAPSITSISARGCTENFHPIFLYEFIFNLVGVGVLLLVERLVRIRPPGALRPLHLVVHARTALRRAAAHRSFTRVPRPAPELLGRSRALRRSPQPSSSGGSSSGSTVVRRRPSSLGGHAPGGPAMAVPKGRVRPPR